MVAVEALASQMEECTRYRTLEERVISMVLTMRYVYIVGVAVHRFPRRYLKTERLAVSGGHQFLIPEHFQRWFYVYSVGNERGQKDPIQAQRRESKTRISLCPFVRFPYGGQQQCLERIREDMSYS